MNVLEQQDVSLYPEQITDDLNLSENHSNMLQNSHEWDLEWDCTMFLMRITNELSLTHMVCTFEVHPDDPACLAWLVQVYLESFTRIYPDISVTPKMHYLVHLPQQMVL